MDDEQIHDLTAAYALDALDPDEQRSYEDHLSGCERCRAELAELTLAASSLAYGAEPIEPPAQLRERILATARAERPNVVPFRTRRRAAAPLIAAVAACAAIALGLWNLSLRDQLHGARNAALEQVPVSGASGSVVVTPGGSGALLLSDLSSAPRGKIYEAWVVQGKRALPAGLFAGGHTTTYLRLTRSVPRGAIVAVTLEPTGGSPQPTSKPFVVSATV